MEKLSNYKTTPEKLFSGKEKFKLTGKVLQRLVLWGLITFNPVVAIEANAQNTNTEKQTTIEEVHSFENRLKNEGLLELKEKHKKPVVVVTTRENIDANYSEQSGFIKTKRSLISEELAIDFTNNEKITVVERGSDVIKAIIDEVRAGDEGLVKQGEGVKLGNWTSADYYVVSSVENVGDKHIIKNEIVDMKDGSSILVTVESSDIHSESVVSELAKKTEEAIEQHELSKKNGQEK